MGWASYLEDIIDRAASGLADVRAQVEATGEPSQGQKEDFLGLLHRAETALAELKRDTELATDPDVQLAHEVHELERRKRDLMLLVSDAEQRIRAAESKLSLVQAETEQVQRELALVRDALKQEKRKNRRLGEVLEKAMDSNPDAVYDQYSTPKQIKKFERSDD